MTSIESGLARRTDPETSHEAAENLNAIESELQVLRILCLYGPPRGPALCVVEIWKYLHPISVDTVSPRMKPLARKKLIRCLGKAPRGNRHDKVRNQLIYEATDLGFSIIRSRAFK